MYKLSPRRSHRSKGLKVKHTLQICLLLAVCFWLLYQVKRSHDKRKEFDTVDETLVNKVQTHDEIQRLGRKDLPRLSDEEKVAEEEANKLEEDDLEKEDSRIKDAEEEDEINENDLEKLDNEDESEKSEADDNKDNKGQVDEDTEKEKNHTEDDDSEEEDKDIENNGHTNIEKNSEGYRNDDDAVDQNRDRDGISTNTQEAREEQYKGDDASSEVAHNIQTETENSTLGHASNIWGEVNFEPGNGTIASNKVDEAINNGGSSNITAEIKSTNLMDTSLNQTENNGNGNSSAPLSFNGTRTLSDVKPNLFGSLLEHENKSKQASQSRSNKTENVNTVGESEVSGNMTSASSHNVSGLDTSFGDGGKSESDLEGGENATRAQEDKELSRDMVHMDTLPLPEIRNEVGNSVNRTTAG